MRTRTADVSLSASTRWCAVLLACGLLVAATTPAARARLAASAAPLALAWRFVTGTNPVMTAPAVGGDGTVYVGAGDGVLYAVTAGGRQRWSLSTGVSSVVAAPTRPVVGPDGTSYWNLGGSLVAVTSAGRLRWVFLAAGGSPVLARGRVLFASGAYLYNLETRGARAGQATWRAAIGASGSAATTGTPAVAPDGTAYVPSSDGYLYAIASDGTRRWALHTGGTLQYSPAVGRDGTVFLDTFGAGHGVLYAVTPAGRLRWRVAVPAGSDVARGMDGTVYVASHLLVAVSPSGHVLWRRVVDAVGPPVALSRSLVVAPSLSPPSLVAVDGHGAVRWRLPLPSAAVGALATGAGGRVYTADYAGTLSALRPMGARRVSTTRGRPLGPPVDLGANNPPYIARYGATAWRVTLARTVERSVDGGRSWHVVLTPGTSLPDSRTGRFRNARYADVTFLAADTRAAGGLYAGTTGALGNYLAGSQGGADGGLYYSADGSHGWRRLTTGLPFTYEPRLHVATYGVDSLVIDPLRRGVLYVQTLPAFGSPGHDSGLYRSVDGGRHWSEATRGLRAVSTVNALLGAYRVFPPGTLLLDRARTNVLFLVASSGIYRSGDGAAHWARVVGVRYGDPASVTIRIGAAGVVRALTDRGVFRSSDFGAHWRRLR